MWTKVKLASLNVSHYPKRILHSSMYGECIVTYIKTIAKERDDDVDELISPLEVGCSCHSLQGIQQISHQR